MLKLTGKHQILTSTLFLKGTLQLCLFKTANLAASLGIAIPHICLPNPEIDLSRWAVIACDQFTSQPEYWQQVESVVGSAPSALRLVLPEIYLEHPRQISLLKSESAKLIKP